jgi:asparagine synthase (glutamine-hydrolysing)
MCGIFFYKGGEIDYGALMAQFNHIKHRGPDNTSSYLQVKKNMFFGFHRLSVNGLDDTSNQPMNFEGIKLICNGEIYNYKDLITKYNFRYHSNSDCEIIIHMYLKFGIHKTVELLDGVFAFVLYDEKKDEVWAARDMLGIRPLFIGKTETEICFASEMKTIHHIVPTISQFPPGCYYNLNSGTITEWYQHKYDEINTNEEDVKISLRDLFLNAVKKRLLSDRPIACLLSGGLDSTLVASILKKEREISTYAIGLEGSEDLKYARIAADYLKTNHTEIIVTEDEFLAAIPETIWMIESYDTTTVRASVGNYLVSKYIKSHSEDTVIFCGDVADEIFGSYRGFTKAPDSQSFKRENESMLKNIHYFDVLRSDRSISGAGLEARVPFADKEFLQFCMSLPSRYKMFDKTKIEKHILREAFKGYLPDKLLYRRKEAFSDGVSSKSRSWFQIIQEFVDTKIDKDAVHDGLYKHNPPYDKESLYYRNIFESYYPDQANIIPYFWKHPFCTEKDPSARLLDVY